MTEPRWTIYICADCGEHQHDHNRVECWKCGSGREWEEVGVVPTSDRFTRCAHCGAASLDYCRSCMIEAKGEITRAIAWVRHRADDLDYAAACEWRNVADAIEGELATSDWRCECGDLNRNHEAFCYRCGAGPPDDAVDVMAQQTLVRDRAARVRSLEAERTELAREIREAHKAGASPAQLMEWSGYSRRMIFYILKGDKE